MIIMALAYLRASFRVLSYRKVVAKAFSQFCAVSTVC